MAHNWLWPMLLALVITTVSICSKHLAPHRHLQLVPAAKCVHSTSFGHYYYLPWSQQLDLEALLRTPTALAAPGDTLHTALAKDHAIIDFVDPSLQKNTTTPGLRAATCPQT